MTNVKIVPAMYLMRNGEVVELTGYYVSSEGTLYRVVGDKKIIVPQNPDHADYLLVNICNPRLATKTGYRSLYVQRIVMSSFNRLGWFKGAVADHIDNNKHNNSLSNLRWIHIAENTKKARCKKVIVVDTVNHTEIVCESISEAIAMTGLSYHHIAKYANKICEFSDFIVRTIR